METEVYKLVKEESAVYYRGNKEIVSATVNGESASLALSKQMPEGSCIQMWEDGGKAEKKCGGWAARVSIPEGTGEVIFKATDDSEIPFSF